MREITATFHVTQWNSRPFYTAELIDQNGLVEDRYTVDTLEEVQHIIADNGDFWEEES